jgi:hypothetical protein
MLKIQTNLINSSFSYNLYIFIKRTEIEIIILGGEFVTQ